MVGRLIANDQLEAFLNFFKRNGAKIISTTPHPNGSETWVRMTIPDLWQLQSVIKWRDEQRELAKQTSIP